MKKIIIILYLIFFKSIDCVNQRLKIGLCITATNRYIKFVEPLINSARKHFLTNHDVTYFIFTDSFYEHKSDTKLLYWKHRPWPYSTLLRFQAYFENQAFFKDMDYLFACDADMLFQENVSDEILSKRVAVRHPLFWNNFVQGRTQYENNPISRALIKNDEGTVYVAGGFYGGTKEEFVKLVKTCTQNINDDLVKNFIAVWHDESHLNRYFIDNPPTLILDPSYCYPENHFKWIKGPFPFTRKLLALDKQNNDIRY